MKNEEPKLIQMHDRIFTRGHTRRIDAERMLTALESRGVRLIVNVAPRIDAELQAACRMVGMTYAHRPLSDGKRIREEEVLSIVRLVADMARHGGGVLVHCNAGRNRTGLIVTLAVAELTGRPTAEVLPELRALRPGLLANQVFEAFVLAR